MSSNYNLRYERNIGNGQTQENSTCSTPSKTQHGSVDDSKFKLKPRENSAPADGLWQYTHIDNVKVLHTAEDAKRYIQNIVPILEINNLDHSSDLTQEMLKRVDYITTAKDEPIEFWYDGIHEKAYLLVLIETKENHCAVGYSYHLLTNDLPSSNNSSANIIQYEPNTLDQFRKAAHQTLKTPASMVNHLITNGLSMREFQNQQLSQPFNNANNGINGQSAEGGKVEKNGTNEQNDLVHMKSKN